MTPADVQLFHRMCEKFRAECPDPYAKAYADAGLGLKTHDEITTRCLYILTNAGHWRGETARACKAELKRISKLKSAS